MTDALPDDAREMKPEEKEIRACDWSDYRKAYGEDPDTRRNSFNHMLFCHGWDAGRRSALPKDPAWLITPHGEKVPIPPHVAAQIRSIEYRNGEPVQVMIDRVHPDSEGDSPDSDHELPIIAPILNAETLSEAVHLAIGNASTHWENMMGCGLYQEDQARAVSEALLQKIESVTGFDDESEDKPAYTADELKIVQAEEPVEWRIHRAFANGYREGLERSMRGRLDHS